MAMQAGVPIVPIVIRNAGQLLWRGSVFMRRGTVDVQVLAADLGRRLGRRATSTATSTRSASSSSTRSGTGRRHDPPDPGHGARRRLVGHDGRLARRPAHATPSCGRAPRRRRRRSATEHRNSRYLPDLDLHPDLTATSSLAEARRRRRRARRRRAVARPAHGTPRRRAARPAVDPDREPDQGPRAGHAAAADRGDRRGPTRATRRACSSGPNLAREVLSGYAAAAVVAMPDAARRGVAAEAVRQPDLPRLHEHRRARLRARRRAQERDRDRGRHGRGPRRRRQHARDGDHARAGRDHPPRRGDGRRPARRSPG